MSRIGTPRVRVLTLVVLAGVPSIGLFLVLVWLQSSDARVLARRIDPPPPETPIKRPFLDRMAGRLLRPGPLSASHAELEGVTACTQCHGTGSHVPDVRCLTCHEEIGLRAERQLPMHGTLEGTCSDCHPDHQGADAPIIELDRESFQHARSRYPLVGAHASLDCGTCHEVLISQASETAFRYQGVPHDSCVSCHSDPHRPHEPMPKTVHPIRMVSLDDAPAVRQTSEPDHPLAGRDCESCHTEASFLAGGLKKDGFRHTDTRYKLRGAHDEVRCESCHTDAIREAERAAGLPPGRGVESSCGGCHEDPHRAALGDGKHCAGCHLEEGWSHGFDHDQHTRFALDPLHARIACRSCHDDLRFRSEGRECAECHREAASLLAGIWNDARGEPDPHDQIVKCSGCHGDSREANATSGLVERCVSCHAPSYGPLLTTWTSELDRLAARSATSASAEQLRRSGLHNFVMARRLLASLARENPVPAGRSETSP